MQEHPAKSATSTGLGRVPERVPATAVLELLPLRRRDVPAFADDTGVDTDAFLAALSKVNGGHVASRPLSLKLVLRSFARTGGLGDNIVEVYRNALGSLCEEESRARLDNRAPTVTTGPERLAVAGRIAACSILGARPLGVDRPAVVVRWHRSHHDRHLGAPGDDDPPGAPVTPGLVMEALRTALFCGRGPDRLGWVHRTYAEFLAASYLVERRAGRAQVEELLVGNDGAVYPQLRPVAAWLAAIDPDKTGWLAVGLVAQVTSHLRSVIEDQQRLAVNLAKDCHLVDLLDDLVELFADTTVARSVRIAAGSAINSFQQEPATDRLRPVALAAPGPDDPDDELKGAALNASWPHAITLCETLDALTVPQDPHLLGAYAVFIAHHLPTNIALSDLPAALQWAQTLAPNQTGDGGLGRLADEIVTRASAAADAPAVSAALVDLSWFGCGGSGATSLAALFQCSAPSSDGRCSRPASTGCTERKSSACSCTSARRTVKRVSFAS